jgi:hypothetical protein
MKKQLLLKLACILLWGLSSKTYAQSDSLNIRVYLEGSLVNNGNNVFQGRPLMRDNLRHNLFTGLRFIPGISPYTSDPFYLSRPNRFRTVGPQNDILVDSTLIFNIQGENAIVDWVFVEIRSKDDISKVIGTRSALVQRDGDVVDINGYSKLDFGDLPDNTGYIVVKHRNHLAVMSKLVTLTQFFDFTNPSSNVYDYGTTISGIDYTGLAQNKTIKVGFRAMWAGDFNADGRIKGGNPNDDSNNLLYGVFLHPNNTNRDTNFDFGYGYQPMDYNLDGKVKYDNPNDDKNMHFTQTILYPLNDKAISNYGRFIEQVPVATQW